MDFRRRVYEEQTIGSHGRATYLLPRWSPSDGPGASDHTFFPKKKREDKGKDKDKEEKAGGGGFEKAVLMESGQLVIVGPAAGVSRNVGLLNSIQVWRSRIFVNDRHNARSFLMASRGFAMQNFKRASK